MSPEERDVLLADAYRMIGWSREAVELVKKLHFANVGLYNSFGAFRSNMLSLVAPDGSLDLYDGGFRARDASAACCSTTSTTRATGTTSPRK